MSEAKTNTMYQGDESLTAYYRQIRNLPLLTFADELELSRRIKNGDDSARKMLVEGNLRLVVKIERQFATCDIQLIDLIQEGNIGLLHAAQKYDFQREVRFSTYASWWIKQAVTRAIANKRRAIRLPHRKEEALNQIRRAFSALSQNMMRTPSVEEIAQEVRMAASDVLMILNMSAAPIRLDMEVGEDQDTMLDHYLDFTYAPEHILEQKSVSDEVNGLLRQLGDTERTVVSLRFALNGGKKQSLKCISQNMGVSAETVRQIEIRAVRKMKDFSAA